MPTAGLPGMGASIRTSATARFRAISSASEVMRLILTPAIGCTSYRVTDGPREMSSTPGADAEALQRIHQLLGVGLELVLRAGVRFSGSTLEQLDGGVLILEALFRLRLLCGGVRGLFLLGDSGLFHGGCHQRVEVFFLHRVAGDADPAVLIRLRAEGCRILGADRLRGSLRRRCRLIERDAEGEASGFRPGVSVSSTGAAGVTVGAAGGSGWAAKKSSAAVSTASGTMGVTVARMGARRSGSMPKVPPGPRMMARWVRCRPLLPGYGQGRGRCQRGGPRGADRGFSTCTGAGSG